VQLDFGHAQVGQDQIKAVLDNLSGEAQEPTPIKYKRPLLYPKQEAAIFYPSDVDGKLARFSFIEAATKTGKTVGCIAWLFEQALFGGAPGHNYWWIAPVYKQAEIAYLRMKRAYPDGTFKTNDGDLTLTLTCNGGTIFFKSGEKADNLYGEDVYAAVIDEASRMREESWWAIRSTLTATRGPCRFIGNVKGRRNWFYALARRAQSGEQGMAHYKIIAADAVRAGVLSGDEIADAKRDLPEAIFRELYLAEPSDDGGNPFGLQHIASCVAPLSKEPTVVWGWDLAKSVDWTVGVGLDTWGRVSQLERWQRIPWEDTITRIRARTANKPALVDSTGVGDPVLESLQKGTRNFEGYTFTPASKQKIMEGLAVAIQSRATTIIEGVHRQEIEDFEYEYTRTGVRYTAPEGFHDDTVCAHALANHHKSHVRAPMVITDDLMAFSEGR
jgi:hypothetical protein